MTTLQLSSDNTQLKHLMKTLQRNDRSRARRIASVVVIMAAVVFATACGHAMRMIHGTGARRPAATEFGLGPRASANRLYVATLEPATQLRTRRLQTVRVAVVDADGRAVDGAALAIDGGMPEHGHGLPTRPRMTRVLGAGAYEVEGVRFNMGGWWEFKVTITSERGADTVTFNLSL
ncbi:MAG: FixH family protein [Vicinamibacterales bacterium]